MGRKKGKQCGNFQSKSQNAAHRHLLYVDHASEANGYRNPVSDSIRARGGGYRNTLSNNQHDSGSTSGQWNGRGGNGGGDKWSSILSSSRSSNSSSATTNVSLGLSRLRFLLEERRTEDRVHDREFRLRLQRSRMREARQAGSNNIQHDGTSSGRHLNVSLVKGTVEEIERHEPGWLLSHSFDNERSLEVHEQTLEEKCDKSGEKFFNNNTDTTNNSATSIPSLQRLAANILARHFHDYVDTCGHIFVGECLKSVHPNVVSELSASLAKLDSGVCSTDRVVKALAHSGTVAGLVLRGLPRETSEEEQHEQVAANSLTDKGLLALCPRLLAADELPDVNSFREEGGGDEDDDSCDDWERLDVDADLTSRMAGCFYLKRLELINFPLTPIQQSGETIHALPGISLEALRHVFRSCPGITHLSLSGCFYNWKEIEFSSSCLRIDESADVAALMCGTQRDKDLILHMANAFQKLNGSNCFNDQGISQFFLNHIFRDYQYKSLRSTSMLGLNELLPELRVLDVSHCSWVNSMMIFQFALQCWERAYFSQSILKNDQSEVVDFDSEWMQAQSYDDDDDIASDGIFASRSRRGMTPHISTTLRHLNVLGCVGLSTSPLSDSQVPTANEIRQRVEEWNNYGLFHGIDLSVNCQTRT